MKLLSAILEDEEKMVMVPLYWLTREDRQKYLEDGYEIIPITGYRETRGYRAFKIIGPVNKDNYWFHKLSIPIWEDWKLTAKYANYMEEHSKTTIGRQMFNRLDDDEKIQTLKYRWYAETRNYILKYFENHPDLLERAKKILTI